jgi:putative holliday junction resolvase
VTVTPVFRPGVRLGIDVGSVRIGVARSDTAGLLATPIETVKRGLNDLERIIALAEEFSAVELIVGLPVALSGDETASTADARGFAQRLADGQSGPVRLIDERLTTVSAHSAMRDVGRSTRESRAVIDQVSAVIILQHALDGERSIGSPPGTVVNRTKDFEL